MDYENFRQAVITPSAMSMVYPKATIKGYSHEQFLNDLLDECEKDIRLCLEKGAHSVQLDFTEARFSMKIDPTGQLLRAFVRLNNQVLERFGFAEQHRLGVHVCPGICFCDLFEIKKNKIKRRRKYLCYHFQVATDIVIIHLMLIIYKFFLNYFNFMLDISIFNWLVKQIENVF